MADRIPRLGRRELIAGLGAVALGPAMPRLAVAQGHPSLSLQAKATQAGAVGDAIAVLNPQSKKTIVAVVTGPGTAEVGPGAEGLRSSNRFATR